MPSPAKSTAPVQLATTEPLGGQVDQVLPTAGTWRKLRLQRPAAWLGPGDDAASTLTCRVLLPGLVLSPRSTRPPPCSTTTPEPVFPRTVQPRRVPPPLLVKRIPALPFRMS